MQMSTVGQRCWLEHCCGTRYPARAAEHAGRGRQKVPMIRCPHRLWQGHFADAATKSGAYACTYCMHAHLSPGSQCSSLPLGLVLWLLFRLGGLTAASLGSTICSSSWMWVARSCMPSREQRKRGSSSWA